MGGRRGQIREGEASLGKDGRKGINDRIKKEAD